MGGKKCVRQSYYLDRLATEGLTEKVTYILENSEGSEGVTQVATQGQSIS